MDNNIDDDDSARSDSDASSFVANLDESVDEKEEDEDNDSNDSSVEVEEDVTSLSLIDHDDSTSSGDSNASSSVASLDESVNEEDDDDDGDNNDSSVEVEESSLIACLDSTDYMYNWQTVRGILLNQENAQDGDVPRPDNNIALALKFAMTHGSVQEIDLLFNSLSERELQQFHQEMLPCSLLQEATCALQNRQDVVEYLVQERGFEVNQLGRNGRTPLYCAVERQHVPIARFLLENGADPNQCRYWEYHPLNLSTRLDGGELVRLLLEYGADPSLQRRDDMHRNGLYDPDEDTPVADRVLRMGNAEILPLLLQHGASFQPVQPVSEQISPLSFPVTPLHGMLLDQGFDPERKLNVCRVLAEHAKKDEATLAFVEASLAGILKIEKALDRNMNEVFRVLLESGVIPHGSIIWYDALCHDGSLSRLLVESDRVDPFQKVSVDPDFSGLSMFILSAMVDDDTSFFEFLLGLWDQRFSANGGKDESGRLPMHLVCRFAYLVDFPAIQLMIERHGHTLMTAFPADDHEGPYRSGGLYPFQCAAMYDASLDTIYSLLRHGPDALSSRLNNHLRVDMHANWYQVLQNGGEYYSDYVYYYDSDDDSDSSFEP